MGFSSEKYGPFQKKSAQNPVLWIRIRDPVLFWPLDQGFVKNQDPNPGFGSGIRYGKIRTGIRYKHPGSATLTGSGFSFMLVGICSTGLKSKSLLID
jgi:hypothetical protein